MVIFTNQLQITFDHRAIEKRFVLLEAKRDNGNYDRSLIPDLVLQAGRALSVVYKRGNCCYILYDRKSTERSRLKAVLESEADVCLREISSGELAQKRSNLLAQLLLNAMPALGAGGRMYHNLTGKLYYLDPSWRRGRGEVPRCFWALWIHLTWDNCVKLSVVTFSSADCRQSSQSEPQYLFDGQSFTLRRLVQKDPDDNMPCFVIKSRNPNHKNNVPFLAFDSLEAFRKSKVGTLQMFLEDAHSLLAPYLTLNIRPLPEDVRLGSKAADSKMEGIRDRLREVPVYLEDTIQDNASAELASLLRRELKQYSGIFIRDGSPGPGEALFRIVHNREFYEDCPAQDSYKAAPRHCAVQHLTVENFQLSEGGGKQAPAKEDASLRKVLQEMAIKLDILLGRITCYDWPSLSYTMPVNFVTGEKTKDNPTNYRRLRVLPDGTLQYSQWQEQLFWEDYEQQKIAAAFCKADGRFDYTVEGLIYETPDNIHIIHQTNQYTLPDATRLQALLAATRDEEWLEIAPLLAAVQSLLSDCTEKDRQNLEILCGELAELKPQASRKQLRACLKLRTSLGQRVNETIFVQTGVLIGNGLKKKATKEALLGGTLGICQFKQGKNQYYYGGYHSESLQRMLMRACSIREVTSTDGEPHFEEYLPLLEVEFVRASAWTVLPFPFKYLREWKP